MRRGRPCPRTPRVGTLLPNRELRPREIPRHGQRLTVALPQPPAVSGLTRPQGELSGSLRGLGAPQARGQGPPLRSGRAGPALASVPGPGARARTPSGKKAGLGPGDSERPSASPTSSWEDSTCGGRGQTRQEARRWSEQSAGAGGRRGQRVPGRGVPPVAVPAPRMAASLSLWLGQRAARSLEDGAAEATCRAPGWKPVQTAPRESVSSEPRVARGTAAAGGGRGQGASAEDVRHRACRALASGSDLCPRPAPPPPPPGVWTCAERSAGRRRGNGPVSPVPATARRRVRARSSESPVTQFPSSFCA